MAIPKKTFLKTMNVFLKTNTFRFFSVFLRLIKESFNITKSFVIGCLNGKANIGGC